MVPEYSHFSIRISFMILYFVFFLYPMAFFSISFMIVAPSIDLSIFLCLIFL